MTTKKNEDTQPWWKHGFVWLVISGPAMVVVAGIATVVIAVKMPDPMVAKDDDRRGIEIIEQLARERALMPAHQARNHAATPVKPVKPE